MNGLKTACSLSFVNLTLTLLSPHRGPVRILGIHQTQLSSEAPGKFPPQHWRNSEQTDLLFRSGFWKAPQPFTLLTSASKCPRDSRWGMHLLTRALACQVWLCGTLSDAFGLLRPLRRARLTLCFLLFLLAASSLRQESTNVWSPGCLGNLTALSHGFFFFLK